MVNPHCDNTSALDAYRFAVDAWSHMTWLPAAWTTAGTGRRISTATAVRKSLNFNRSARALVEHRTAADMGYREVAITRSQRKGATKGSIHLGHDRTAADSSIHLQFGHDEELVGHDCRVALKAHLLTRYTSP